jgi:kynurenine 3-monooxygenase
MKKEHMCIVGAGLSGTLLAIRLAERGYKVSLFEKRPDMRKSALDAGRSINLALSDRGWKALRLVGLEEEIRKQVIPMHGRLVHPIEGKGWLSPYSGREGEHINSVSRPGLNIALLNAAEKHDNLQIHFDHTCTDVDHATGRVTFRGKTNEAAIHADVIFGTDGAGSAVRKNLFDLGPQLRFSYSQQWLDHGYKELSIPATAHGGWRLEKHALHIWPRQDFMLIALPNLDGSFTVTLFLAFDGKPGFNQLNTDPKIKSFFADVFPSANKHMPDLIADFHDNPTSSLATIKCLPWQLNGRVLLLGDAAHAVVPFYGQGMNCSMEDVVVLDKYIEQHEGDWDAILKGYEKERKKDADAIGDLAVENYYEMRDHVDDPAFKLKRQLEMQLEKKHPEYSSKYNLVTFNEEVPYSVAMHQGRAQDKFLLEFCKDRTRIDDVDLGDLLVKLQDIEY